MRTMDAQANRDQKDFWTDEAGPKWVAQQAYMDALLRPVLDALLIRARLANGQHVLDLGCGAGESTFRAAELIGADGHAMGIDISPTLLKVAEARARNHSNVSFVCEDAATHRFDVRRFHRMISRFGTMFFDDPVPAFENILGSLRPGGQMIFATWGQIDANPYFKTVARVARDVLGPVPKTDPDLPGPFALRDPGRINAILTDADFKEIDIEVVSLDLTPQGTLRDFAENCCVIGPAERALVHHKADAAARERLIKRLELHFQGYQSSAGLQIPAEINFVTARKSS